MAMKPMICNSLVSNVKTVHSARPSRSLSPRLSTPIQCHRPHKKKHQTLTEPCGLLYRATCRSSWLCDKSTWPERIMIPHPALYLKTTAKLPDDYVKYEDMKPPENADIGPSCC